MIMLTGTKSKRFICKRKQMGKKMDKNQMPLKFPYLLKTSLIDDAFQILRKFEEEERRWCWSDKSHMKNMETCNLINRKWEKSIYYMIVQWPLTHIQTSCGSSNPPWIWRLTCTERFSYQALSSHVKPTEYLVAEVKSGKVFGFGSIARVLIFIRYLLRIAEVLPRFADTGPWVRRSEVVTSQFWSGRRHAVAGLLLSFRPLCFLLLSPPLRKLHLLESLAETCSDL